MGRYGGKLLGLVFLIVWGASPGSDLVSGNCTGLADSLFTSFLKCLRQGVGSPLEVLKGIQVGNLCVSGGFRSVADLVLVVLGR